MSLFETEQPHAKVLLIAADMLSAGAIVGSIAQVLPPLAALVGCVWYVIQIYESDTVQTYLHERHLLHTKPRRRKKRKSHSTPDPTDFTQ